LEEYQDTSDRSVTHTAAVIDAIDRTKDIVVLTTPNIAGYRTPGLGSLDDVKVGEDVVIIGYPHCVNGRLVTTVQHTKIGAKVLLASAGSKIKHAVINIQTRPGQSGSLVYSEKTKKIVGMLVGTYIPEMEGMISVSGVNPAELNQTSHVISAEYVSNMI
jgi:S1-C subfamily serine protease